VQLGWSYKLNSENRPAGAGYQRVALGVLPTFESAIRTIAGFVARFRFCRGRKAPVLFVILIAGCIVAFPASHVFGQTDPPPPAPPPAVPAEPTKLYVYSGTIRSIDKQARIIMVESSSISEKFIVPTNAKIVVKDKPKAELSDLMVGDHVEVQYAIEDGNNIAYQISALGLKIP